MAVDYYALGVIVRITKIRKFLKMHLIIYIFLNKKTYEFMLGRRPYVGKSRKDIRDAILSR